MIPQAPARSCAGDGRGRNCTPVPGRPAGAETVAARWNGRQGALLEAEGLAGVLACEVTPHPLLPGRFEATYEGGVMIGTAEELRASDRAAGVRAAARRRLEMLAWLWWFQAAGRSPL